MICYLLHCCAKNPWGKTFLPHFTYACQSSIHQCQQSFLSPAVQVKYLGGRGQHDPAFPPICAWSPCTLQLAQQHFADVRAYATQMNRATASSLCMHNLYGQGLLYHSSKAEIEAGTYILSEHCNFTPRKARRSVSPELPQASASPLTRRRTRCRRYQHSPLALARPEIQLAKSCRPLRPWRAVVQLCCLCSCHLCSCFPCCHLLPPAQAPSNLEHNTYRHPAAAASHEVNLKVLLHSSYAAGQAQSLGSPGRKGCYTCLTRHDYEIRTALLPSLSLIAELASWSLQSPQET